jgi:glutaredoxin
MSSVSVPKLIGIFAITTLIFLSGFMFAKFLTESKLSDLEQAVNDVSLQTASIETEYNLLLENPCSYGGFSRLTASLDALGEKLVFNKAQKQQDQTRIDSIKNNYFLLETRHWMFVQKLNSECHTNYTTILYFYSEEKCSTCEAQGIVLSEIKKAYPYIMIYSFDMGTDYSLVNAIKEINNVTTAPSLVINGKLYGKFLTQEDLEKILGAPKTNTTINQNQTTSNSSNNTVA